jgi:hypothetical protein
VSYINYGMGFDRVVRIMKYLGYVTHYENGEMTPAAMSTAKALSDMPEGSLTSSVIATEYAKHNPRFMRGTVSK